MNSRHHTSHITTSDITQSHLTTSHILHISPHQTSHIHISPYHTSQGPSSWAGWLITPHHTSHIHISLTTSNITHSHVTTSHITSRKKRTQRRSSWAEFLGRKKKFLGEVPGPDGSPSQGPSSWAGWLITPHHTSHIHISPHQTSHIHISPYHTSQAERREHKEEVLGPSFWAGWHSHHITHHHIDISPHQTSQAESAKKYEFCYENLVIRTIRDQRKVRELPRKMKIEEVAEPKKYENYHAKPVSDPFKTIAEHRKVRDHHEK